MNYIKNIRNAALYSPYEIKVRDLTSNDPFAGNAQRARKDVAEATSNYENFLVTMRVLWERLNDTGRNWRHVYKGLQLMEYLLVYGSENIVLDAKNNLNRIKILRSFTYIDDHSFNDYGEGVRRLSERVLKTLSNDSQLKEYRRQAEEGTFQGFPKLTDPSGFSQKKSGGADEKPQRRKEEDYDRVEREEPRRRRDDYDERPQRRRDEDYDRDERPQQRSSFRREEDYDERPRPKQPQQQPVQQQQQKSGNLIGGLDFENEDDYGNDDPYLQQYQEPSQHQNLGAFDQQGTTSTPLTDQEYEELLDLRSQLEHARHENEVLRRQLEKARHQYDNLYRNTQH
jgi:epsin